MESKKELDGSEDAHLDHTSKPQEDDTLPGPIALRRSQAGVWGAPTESLLPCPRARKGTDNTDERWGWLEGRLNEVYFRQAGILRNLEKLNSNLRNLTFGVRDVLQALVGEDAGGSENQEQRSGVTGQSRGTVSDPGNMSSDSESGDW